MQSESPHQFEPAHDKPTKWPMRSAKPQISLSIRSVWSEASLCALRIAKDPRFLHADSEDSGQTGRMPRLICLRWAHRSFCWFCHVAALFYFSEIHVVIILAAPCYITLLRRKFISNCFLKYGESFTWQYYKLNKMFPKSNKYNQISHLISSK